ncbi:MAG: peptidoglycan DD-metalloendopeptidase family protein [Maritimibacter sp.]|nr:peptidoglycan DD-metalloendopeptidase family protein [Maritimibacter sp.]
MAVSVRLPFSSNGASVAVTREPGVNSHSGELYNSWDFALSAGTKVLAIAAGTVVDIRETVPDGASTQTNTYDISMGSGNIGNQVTLRHVVNGVVFYSTYMHLAQNSVPVNINDTVAAGQVIGAVGNTGIRTGTHLHLQVGTTTIQWGATDNYGWPSSSDNHTPETIANASNTAANQNLVSFDVYGTNLPSYVIGPPVFVGPRFTSGNDSATMTATGNVDALGGNDTVFGSSGNDTINGGSGDDMLYGSYGNDSVIGSFGNDTLAGNDGHDYLRGDSGLDRLYGGEGNDTLLGGTENDYLSGQGGSNRLYGESGNDTLLGGSLNDYLSGGSGADMLLGDAGNDTLVGSTGDDTLAGNAGSDRLYGQAGTDWLYGNSGADYFYFYSTSDFDSIRDFENDVDTLYLQRSLWGGANLTVAQVISRYGVDKGSYVVLDFAGNEDVEIRGISDLSMLLNDISFF